MVIAVVPVLLGLASVVTGELTVGERGLNGGALTFFTALSSIIALLAVPVLLILAIFRRPAFGVDHEQGTVWVRRHRRPIADLQKISVWDAGNPNQPLSIDFVFSNGAFSHRFHRAHRGSRAVEALNSLRLALPAVPFESFVPAVPTASAPAPVGSSDLILGLNAALSGVDETNPRRATDTYEVDEFSEAEAARFRLMKGDPDETGTLRRTHDRFAADAGFPKPLSTFPNPLTLTAVTGSSAAAQAIVALMPFTLLLVGPLRAGIVGVVVEQIGPPGWPILAAWLVIVTALGSSALVSAVSTFRPDTVTLDAEGLWVRRWFRAGYRIPIFDISSARLTTKARRRDIVRTKRLVIRTSQNGRAHRLNLSVREPDRIRQLLSNLEAAAPHADVVSSFVVETEMRGIRLGNAMHDLKRRAAERRSTRSAPPEG
jgi:hypothetical protein